MKKLESLVVLMFVVFTGINFFTSCDDDKKEEVIIENEEKVEEVKVSFGMTRKLNKWKWHDEETIISYDSQNRVVRIETPRYNEVITYQYLDDKIVKRDNHVTYTYCVENNKIKSMTEVDDYYEGDYDCYTYNYNENGRVDYIERIINYSDGDQKKEYLKLTWKNGNIVKAEQTDKSQTYYYEYKYEDKGATCNFPIRLYDDAGIFYDWMDDFLVAEGYFGKALPENYPTEIKSVWDDQASEPHTENYFYEMDSKGYVLKSYYGDEDYKSCEYEFVWE